MNASFLENIEKTTTTRPHANIGNLVTFTLGESKKKSILLFSFNAGVVMYVWSY